MLGHVSWFLGLINRQKLMPIFSQYTSKILMPALENTIFCGALMRFTYFCNEKKIN